MKRRYQHIILFITLLFSYNAYSQVNCTVPLSPVFTVVSVEPETGRTEFTWTPSPSTDIAAYIVYTYKDGVGMSIDTLWDPLSTSYILTNNATKYSSVSYVIAAHRLSATPGMPGCTSPLSNSLTTIFAAAEFDTCNKKIEISWNNYVSYPKNVTDYSILISVNGGGFTEAARVTPAANHFTINDFLSSADYCFVVRANLEGGAFSTSNSSCVETRMLRPPDWINADYATVNESRKISLAFSIDPLSEITHFRLEKKTGVSGNFQSIAEPVSSNNTILFTDNQSDINLVNFYRLSALNSCNNPVIVSNICSNLVLSLESINDELSLTWNLYKEWSGSVAFYQVFIGTGNGFEEKAVLEPSDSIFRLDYKQIMYDITGDQVCIYVKATEASNPHGITGTSQSPEVCISPTEVITVPNVFTPNNDLVNDMFRPVLSFTPKDYHLVIGDRQGNILFETRDFNAAWDGSQGGSTHSQDVCLWFLKVTTPSGKRISRTGTVTILNNR